MTHADVLTSIGISIIAAAVLALLARRIRQPLILGYILGGALLGPHVGLGLVTDETSIELISEMGLILLLFIIGLEISIPRLLQAGRTIAVTGLLQFPLSVLLTWFVWRGLSGGGGRFDWLYVAVAFGLSSTLIVVKLLFDKLEMATFTGRVTLGILIFQDLWAIAFLALQPNLGTMAAAPLLRSAVAGAALVGGAALLSRFVLPRLFRSIAASSELMLLASMAWCFLLSGFAGWAGLSKEMGSLIAGMVIAGFPYGTEVTARLTGVRDFFITLFFVSLGLKIPSPTPALLFLALGATAFVVVSRFVVLVPLFALLRVDLRSAGVVAINLGQISEFSLVIVTLGLGFGHVSPQVSALVLFTLLITSVLSTYGILFNHEIARRLAQALGWIGLRPWAGRGSHRGETKAAEIEPDVFFLGLSREGLAFLQQLERQSPATKARIFAIDFNPETLERLEAAGVACHYGDIASSETLQHAGVERARIVVSSISDWFLKGIDNLRLLRLVRGLAPRAEIIVTADSLAHAENLYSEGAAYVLIPPALAAEHLYDLLCDPSHAALPAARARQAAEVFDAKAPRPATGQGAHPPD